MAVVDNGTSVAINVNNLCTNTWRGVITILDKYECTYIIYPDNISVKSFVDKSSVVQCDNDLKMFLNSL